MPTGPGCGRSWASCASWPACSRSRSTPTDGRPDCCATTRRDGRGPRPPGDRAHRAPVRFTTALRVVGEARRLCWRDRLRTSGAPHDGAAGQPHGPGPGGAGAARGGHGTGPCGRWRGPASSASTRPWCARSCSSTLSTSSWESRAWAQRHREALEICIDARTCASSSQRSRMNLGDARLLRGSLDRGRRSGTARAVRWPWRRAARSSRPRRTSTSPSCSSTRASSTRRRRSSSMPCGCCGRPGP